MPSFFKLNKNKKFSYTPRYYDERKERLENLKKQAAGEETSAESRIRGKIRRSKTQKMPGLFSGASMRTFLILGVLVLIVYYYLKKYSLL